MKLTNTAVMHAKPKDKQYKMWDGDGFYLIVRADGKKWWRLKFFFNGIEDTAALGVYQRISLAQARERKNEIKKLLALGINPKQHRKEEKALKKLNSENSFEVVAREWWKSHMTNKADSHKEKVIRRFELYLFPWIGNQAISTLTAPQVLEVIKRIEKQNILETAHRTLQTAGQVFRYAVQTGRAVRDVSADLKGALPARNVKHMAAFTEPKDVAELLRAFDAFNGTLTVQCAIRLAPLVFVRPSELRMAKWADIDLENATWNYLVSKTKTDHIVPLSSQAVKILREIHPLSGRGQYVFQGGHSPLKPMSESAVNAALKRMGYDTQKDITGHGFRAMARTILHERLNIDPYIIEHQLAHKVPDTLGAAYNRTKFIEQRKIMMQAWADYLDELKAGAKVIAFKKVSD
jgi:integrase